MTDSNARPIPVTARTAAALKNYMSSGWNAAAEDLAGRGLLTADLPDLAINPEDGNPEGTAAGFTVAVDWGEVEITAPDGTCYARSVEEVEELTRLFAAAAAYARAEYGY